MAEFQDLAIGLLNEKETYKRSGPWWEYVYEFTGPVPDAWAALFVEVWQGAHYAPKRHARIEEGRLATVCLPAELKDEHMRFLHVAVERTNAAYREQLAGEGEG